MIMDYDFPDAGIVEKDRREADSVWGEQCALFIAVTIFALIVVFGVYYGAIALRLI